MNDRQSLPTPTEELTWRRSSRSDGAGGNNCVEITLWRKSTRSSGGGGSNCIEIALLRKRTRIPYVAASNSSASSSTSL
ncbi:DUF397 domain-containing protein [Stackebrandtia sp.]|uniref:DUF397 domain-containing protein n=1 Tax=Stackebrandtia sp. TaxID=2023065 RepID=UPI0032C2208C